MLLLLLCVVLLSLAMGIKGLRFEEKRTEIVREKGKKCNSLALAAVQARNWLLVIIHQLLTN